MATWSKVVRESAWGKVNLTFEVGPRRPDGYHEVASLMVAIGWCDGVRVTLGGRVAEPVRLRVRGRGAPRGRANLAARAASAWARGDPGVGPVSIELAKRLPSGAGLGGGSSDAAAVLRALGRLRPRTLSPADLAPALGSDVAFFAHGWATAYAAGRGERLAPAPPLPAAWWLVLVKPPFGLSTADVYHRLDRLREGRRLSAPGAATHALGERLDAWAAGGEAALGEEALMEVEAMLHNDLWEAALSLRPELGRVGALVRSEVGAGRPVSMTGSGSCLFAIVEDAGRAQAAARRLRARGLWARALRQGAGVAEAL